MLPIIPVINTFLQKKRNQIEQADLFIFEHMTHTYDFLTKMMNFLCIYNMTNYEAYLNTLDLKISQIEEGILPS
ncbi:hypothetical protein DLEV_133 [Diachasmimorpha longicaudata entomopoxvirus]|uniref:Uncharacterized protein n=1 Tax=Diachasmimorpha longicaudata entomopoxvirus TaxID=109981 RepID=A0A7R5WMM1_9POXV|nr:hypothetical protein QKK69_gp133 [Diachasmimorpha longicaudata entomopoxvirus]AKS26424.1 hypothetical protein DLEV_133 [Diachasmimorpha longicaudata entomopoxvirus]